MARRSSVVEEERSEGRFEENDWLGTVRKLQERRHGRNEWFLRAWGVSLSSLSLALSLSYPNIICPRFSTASRVIFEDSLFIRIS